MAIMLDHIICAYIDCTLKLEDCGPTQQYVNEVEDNFKVFCNRGYWFNHVPDISMSNFICKKGNCNMYKCKNHFIEMKKDIGMARILEISYFARAIVRSRIYIQY